jgi:hypothetical protein
VRLLLLLLFAVPCIAQDSKTYTQEQVDSMFNEFRELRRMDRSALFEGFKQELIEREHKIEELERKVQSLTGRSVCT